jgi:DNA-binding transcriptional LysR family regulator
MHAMHIADLNVTQIRLIAELLRLRSVSAASESIGLSQPAASHALAKLRRRFGDPLFTRTTRGFEPTPYGERLGIAAREAIDALVAGIASNRPFEPRTTTRRFNFYMSDVGQTVFMPSLIAFLQKEAPGAMVRSAPIPLDDPGAALSRGEVDLAVGYFTNLTTGFHQRLLFHEKYVCVVRANHPQFRSGMTVDAFKSVRHAIADATGMAHGQIDKVLLKHSAQRRDILCVPAFHVLPTIVASSDLLAVVPSRLAAAMAPHLPIKVLPVPIPFAPWGIRMYWHERYHQNPPLQWLRQVFVDLFCSKKGRH